MPTFDVIMPAYNAARFLPMALDSVIAQTFEDWRILVVDDGSTDNTPDVIAPYAARLGPQLTYIRQPNSGPSAARNTALRLASADYVALLDADDLWLPCRLEESLKIFAARPHVGLVHGFNARIDLHGNVIDTFAAEKKHGDGRIAAHIYMRTVDLPCCTVSIRRSCIDEVGLFDESLLATEDRDLWVRIALRYEVGLVPKVVAHYRISPLAATTDPGRMLRGQLQFVEKHYGAPGCGARARRIALSGIYRQRAEAFAGIHKQRAALASALKALTYNPLSLSNARTAGSLLLRNIRPPRSSASYEEALTPTRPERP